MRATVRIDVDVLDTAKLHAAATDDYVTRDGGSVEAAINAADFLGDEKNPDVENCLRQLFDRELPVDCGIDISDSFAEIDPPALPRSSTMIHLSTGHLRPAERQAINDALGIGIVDQFPGTARALVHAEHCGLFLKPKDCGFFVRVPIDGDDDEPEGLSAEMTAILAIAKKAGAWMIDFDVDEEPLPGLPIFGDKDRQFIIRDFGSGIGEDDEPLYWNNHTGWGCRSSADRYSETELADYNLPMIGSEPAWVDAADLTDQRYQQA
jgi:hypothetical protein